jgi:predicted RNA polymerase sigma factor
MAREPIIAPEHPDERERGQKILPSVRGDLLAKLGRHDEARADFGRAASLTRSARERQLLLERAEACARASRGSSP